MFSRFSPLVISMSISFGVLRTSSWVELELPFISTTPQESFLRTGYAVHLSVWASHPMVLQERTIILYPVDVLCCSNPSRWFTLCASWDCCTLSLKWSLVHRLSIGGKWCVYQRSVELSVQAIWNSMAYRSVLSKSLFAPPRHCGRRPEVYQSRT